MSKRSDELYLQNIGDFRNKLIHEYFGIDAEIVWNTIKEDLPILKNQIDDIIRNEND